MISESVVNDKIHSILFSYSAVQGVSVEEYLMIRRAALDEIRLGFGWSAEPAPVQMPERKAEVCSDPAPVRDDKSSPAAETPVGGAVENKKPKAVKPKETKAKVKSDFDILRSIKDPWN